MVVSKEIKTYLKTWIASDEVKDIFNNLLAPLITHDSMEELLKKYVQGDIIERLSELETRVSTQQAELDQQQSKINELEAGLAFKSNIIEKLVLKCDDNEQYSRRTSVRLYGIEAATDDEKENIKEKVLAACESINVKFDPSTVDRMHRIGKKIVKDGITYQAVIIKFKWWYARNDFFISRPKGYDKDGTKKPGLVYSIGHDLTKRRYELLKHARSVISNFPNVSFAFADINCSLALRSKNNRFYYFNNQLELDKILAKL